MMTRHQTDDATHNLGQKKQNNNDNNKEKNIVFDSREKKGGKKKKKKKHKMTDQSGEKQALIEFGQRIASEPFTEAEDKINAMARTWVMRTRLKGAMIAMISVESTLVLLFFLFFNIFNDTAWIDWAQILHALLILLMIYLIYENSIERGNKILAVFTAILFFIDVVVLFSVRFVEWRQAGHSQHVANPTHEKLRVKLFMLIFQTLFVVDDLILLLIAASIWHEVADQTIRLLYYDIPRLQRYFIKLAFALQLSTPNEYINVINELCNMPIINAPAAAASVSAGEHAEEDVIPAPAENAAAASTAGKDVPPAAAAAGLQVDKLDQDAPQLTFVPDELAQTSGKYNRSASRRTQMVTNNNSLFGR